MQDKSHLTLDTAVSKSETGPEPSNEEGVSTMFCTQCGTRNGSDAKFCKQCGHRLERTGPLKISEEDFQLPESRDEKVRDLLLEAFKKYEVGDIDAAVVVCSEALELRPESTDAHSLMSTLYEKKGETERAIAERERVLVLNPGSIADREKLDELRDGHVAITPRKITSSHRSNDAPILTSIRLQAAAAIAVIIVVFGIATGAMVWVAKQNKASMADASSRQVSQPPNPAVVGTTNPGSLQAAPGTQGTTQTSANQAQPNQGTNIQPALNGGNGANSQANQPNLTTQERRQRDRDSNPTLSTSELRPAPINPGIDSSGGRVGRGAIPERGSSVILPDTGPNTEPGTSQPQGSTAGQQNNNRTKNSPQGTFEIVVTRDPGANASGASGGSKSTTDSTGSLDSRGNLEVARDLHNKLQYSKAITFYRKALDGAGDGAGDIHQKIGLCYQALGEKETAINQYQQAIDSFKSLVAAGKNVDSAKQAIRSCERSIKACQ